MSSVAAASPEPVLFDPARLDRADTVVRADPFCFLVAREQLPATAAGDLERDFPKYAGAGFFPYEEKDCGPSVNQLVADLERKPGGGQPRPVYAVDEHLSVVNVYGES